MKKDLLSGFDLNRQELVKIFKLSGKIKKEKYNKLLKGRLVALIFQKPSVRTRVSFETGAYQMGAHCIYLAPADINLGSREPIKDVARVMSRYVDCIVARTFSHKHVLELAERAEVSVINGLSDMYHPAQALADIFTMYEKKKNLKKCLLSYVGDGNNVVHSLLALTATMGISFSVATPKGYEPDKEVWARAQKIAKKSGAKITLYSDPKQAVQGADFVYTDVWTSMGQEKETAQRKKKFKKFQINRKLLAAAGSDPYILHCMPMHRGEEITDEVIESKKSIIFDQAENRMHVQKAVMAMLLKKK